MSTPRKVLYQSGLLRWMLHSIKMAPSVGPFCSHKHRRRSHWLCSRSFFAYKAGSRCLGSMHLEMSSMKKSIMPFCCSWISASRLPVMISYRKGCSVKTHTTTAAHVWKKQLDQMYHHLNSRAFAPIKVCASSIWWVFWSDARISYKGSACLFLYRNVFLSFHPGPPVPVRPIQSRFEENIGPGKLHWFASNACTPSLTDHHGWNDDASPCNVM